MTISIPGTSFEGAVGNYDGDGTANRAITHGLGRRPDLVMILKAASGTGWLEIATLNVIYCMGNVTNYTVDAMDETDFHVGNVANLAQSANENAVTYYWVAI